MGTPEGLQRLADAFQAETVCKLAEIETLSSKDMTYDERVAAIRQMFADLDRMAADDGNVAAAWAADLLRDLSYLSAGTPEEPTDPYPHWHSMNEREQDEAISKAIG